ncbi:MAG TPA: helix-turn-helix domain-containing protein [Gemmatimonadaceae bacterium]|nr:helix-turn-helix domain-containing protein [Gemmatimonadaceae bacterium]
MRPPRPTPPPASKGTRRQILDLLRRSPLTAKEIGAELGLTHNAIRGHLAALQRDNFVREGSLRRGGTRPAMVYELVPRADSVLSRAYVPFVAQLLRVLGERMTKEELDDLMRTVGRRLGAQWPPLRGDLGERVNATAGLLEELGSLTELEAGDGGYTLRGYGCLLGEAVHGRPEVCQAVESLIAHLVEAPVRECCEHGEHPRCCFEIMPS